MDMDTDNLVGVTGLLLGVLCLGLFFRGAGGCDVSEPTARRLLEVEGYTEIQLGGYAWFSCDSDDTFATEFFAHSAGGKPVVGAVCCGLFKYCTVRLAAD